MSTRSAVRWTQLSDVQRAVLFGLARAEPYRWKSRIRAVWSGRRVLADGDSQALVWALRNSHGPTWLIQLRLVVRRARFTR